MYLVCYLLVELHTSYSLCREGMCSYIAIMEFNHFSVRFWTGNLLFLIIYYTQFYIN